MPTSNSSNDTDSEKEDDGEPESQADPKTGPRSEVALGEEAEGFARSQRNWTAFTFQHEKLKHLTTVGLLLSGGFITLFQSDMMDATPQSLVALALPILSSMQTLAAQVGLGNEVPGMGAKGRSDEFGIPMSVHWYQVVALMLLGGAFGYLGYNFFSDIGLLQ